MPCYLVHFKCGFAVLSVAWEIKSILAGTKLSEELNYWMSHYFAHFKGIFCELWKQCRVLHEKLKPHRKNGQITTNNMNISKAYRSVQQCDKRTTWTSMNTGTFSRTTIMFVKHKCPCPHKVQITGLFSKSVTIQAKTLGLVLLWKNMQEMGLDGPVLYLFATVWEL